MVRKTYRLSTADSPDELIIDHYPDGSLEYNLDVEYDSLTCTSGLEADEFIQDLKNFIKEYESVRKKENAS